MSEVWIVFGEIEYEGTDAIAVFSSAHKANLFLTDCMDYEKYLSALGMFSDEWRAARDEHVNGLRRTFDQYSISCYEVE